MDTQAKREQDQAPGRAPAAGQPDPARRNLLKAAPLGALAVAALATGRATAAPAAAVAPVAAPAAQPSGYHETEHIRRYYRTATYW